MGYICFCQPLNVTWESSAMTNVALTQRESWNKNLHKMG